VRHFYEHYGLDPAGGFGLIAAILREFSMAQSRRIVWLNVVTVVSAAILIGAEVFGAAFAGSWALATLFDLGTMGQRILDGVFVLLGVVVMAQFIRFAHRIEPFTARG
jgi:fatty acid desaturase